jgi:hypothetical protein
MPETTLANQSLRNTGFLKESQMEVSLIQGFANSVFDAFCNADRLRIFENLHPFLRKSRVPGAFALLGKTSDE